MGDGCRTRRASKGRRSLMQGNESQVRSSDTGLRARLARGGFVAAVTAALIGSAVIFGGINGGPAVAQTPQTPQTPQAVQALPSFADMIDQVQPAVVTVSTTEKVKRGDQQDFEFNFDMPEDTP